MPVTSMERGSVETKSPHLAMQCQVLINHLYTVFYHPPNAHARPFSEEKAE